MPRCSCLLLHFRYVVSQFVDTILLLFQSIQYDAHWGLLQAYSFHLVLQLVLYVPEPQRSMDEHHCMAETHLLIVNAQGMHSSCSVHLKTCSNAVTSLEEDEVSLTA